MLIENFIMNVAQRDRSIHTWGKQSDDLVRRMRNNQSFDPQGMLFESICYVMRQEEISKLCMKCVATESVRHFDDKEG